MTFIRKASGLPVGSKIEVFSKIVPKGFLLCDGSRVLKSQYQKLYGVIGDSFQRLTNEYGNVLNQDPLKFWLPEFSNSVFVANGRKKYADVYQNMLGSPSDINVSYTTRYIATVKRTWTSPTYSTTLVHTTKTSGKHYFAIRLKDIVFNVGDLGQIMFDCVGGVNGNTGYQVSIELVRSGANVYFSNCKVFNNGSTLQLLTALNGTLVNHQEIVFAVDLDNKTGVIVVNGVTYNLLTLATVPLYQIRTGLYKNGTFAVLEIGYLPDSEIMGYDVIAANLSGFKHVLELDNKEFVFNEKLGSATHSHTVGGTALTIGQMPPHTHGFTDRTVFDLAANNSIGLGTDHKNVYSQTDSSGLGETHAHGLTVESSLPPHVTAMFAIKYK